MAQNETLILRATLEGKSSIYRDVEIESSKSLYTLAETITSAFGFNFDHAFGFYSGLKPATMMCTSPKYELFADMGDADPGVLSVKKTKVAQAFPAIGHTMLFLFDYGDDWLFRVKLEKTAKKIAKVRYPRIVGTHGEAPEQYPTSEEFDENAPTFAINLATGERMELRKRGRKTG